MRLRVDRPHLGRPFERIADADRFRLGDHALHDLIIDRVVNEQAAGGAARLSLPDEVHSQHRRLGDLLDGRVGKYDERVLAAQLERN